MKLVYFITGLRYGGAEIGMTRVISALLLSDVGDELEIVVVSLVQTPRDVLSHVPENVTVIHIDIGSPYRLDKLAPLWHHLSDTDVLICSLYHASVVGTVMGRLRRVSHIFTWQHSNKYRSSNAKRLYWVAYQLSDRVLVDSDAVKQVVLNQPRIDESKISVVPVVGINTDLFSPSTGLEHDCATVHVGTVGRLVKFKGYDYLLDVAEQIGTDMQFHIIGEGELESDLRADIRSRGLKNVQLHGVVPYNEIPGYLNSFDIYFQPSRNEGLCMTVIEAMSTGLPIVASAVGGIKESVVHSENGYQVPIGDIDEYVRYLRILAQDENKRMAFGKRSRERAIECYSESELQKRLCSIIAA